MQNLQTLDAKLAAKPVTYKVTSLNMAIEEQKKIISVPVADRKKFFDDTASTRSKATGRERSATPTKKPASSPVPTTKPSTITKPSTQSKSKINLSKMMGTALSQQYNRTKVSMEITDNSQVLKEVMALNTKERFLIAQIEANQLVLQQLEIPLKTEQTKKIDLEKAVKEAIVELNKTNAQVQDLMKTYD